MEKVYSHHEFESLKKKVINHFEIKFDLNEAIRRRKEKIFIPSKFKENSRMKSITKNEAVEYLEVIETPKENTNDFSLNEDSLSNQLSKQEQKTFKKMLDLLIKAENGYDSHIHKPNKNSIKLNQKILASLKVCEKAEDFKEILKEYTKAKQNGVHISHESYEALSRKTLEFGMLDWTAIFLTDIEKSGMRVSRKILDEFLRLNYVQKILNSYYQENDSDEEDEKTDKGTESKQLSSKEHVTKIVKYLKRLSSKSEEFHPESKFSFNTQKEEEKREDILASHDKKLENEGETTHGKKKKNKNTKKTSQKNKNPFNSLK